MSGAVPPNGTSRREAVEALKRARPRDRFVRWSLVAFLLILVGSWWLRDFGVADVLSERSRQNFDRFLDEARPDPFHATRRNPDPPAFSWSITWDWVQAEMSERGWEALTATVAISILAIVLAALIGYLLSVPAARTIATPTPFAGRIRDIAAGERWAWAALRGFVRVVLVFFRALPEYIWVFLLLKLLGITPWAAVLALSLHNAGILGRLGAESLENTPGAPLRALRGAGGTRLSVLAVGGAPQVLPRFLLYFFYRWETCVRESTALGFLGIVSLGYWVSEFWQRSGAGRPKMLLYVLLGSVIVLVGDLISALARRWIRRG